MYYCINADPDVCPRVATSHIVLLPWRRRVMLNSHASALLNHIGWQSAKCHMSVRILLFFNLSKFRNIYLVGDDAPSKLVQKFWNISHKLCLSDRPKLKNSIFVTTLSPHCADSVA